MGYGLSITNPAGELVVSSDAQLLHCLGKATLESIVQVSGDATGGKTTARKGGYSTYILTLPADQTAFSLAIDAPINRAVGVLNITWIGTGQYRIKAYCGTNVYDGYGFDTQQVAVDIWAFGYVNNVSGNYGLTLYDKNGNLSADFSRPNPLFPRFMSDFTSTTTQTIPSLTRPVILGSAQYHVSDIYERGTGYLYDYIEDVKLWNRSAATTLQVVNRRMKYYGCNELNDGMDDPQGIGRAIAIVLEGSSLP